MVNANFVRNVCQTSFFFTKVIFGTNEFVNRYSLFVLLARVIALPFNTEKESSPSDKMQHALTMMEFDHIKSRVTNFLRGDLNGIRNADKTLVDLIESFFNKYMRLYSVHKLVRKGGEYLTRPCSLNQIPKNLTKATKICLFIVSLQCWTPRLFLQDCLVSIILKSLKSFGQMSPPHVEM